MRKAVIHIGSGKTGSSSIQKTLLENSNLKSYSYPVIEGAGHQNLECLFKEESEVSRALKSKLSNRGISFNKYVKMYRNEFLRSDDLGKDIVISSEYFFGFSIAQIEKLREFVENDLGVSETYVVCYVRDPSSYYLSYVQQKLKASFNYPSPSEFIYNFAEAIKCWSSCFDNFLLREFDAKTLVDGDVVADFSKVLRETLGLDCDLEPIRVNESISVEGMVALQKYRKMFYGLSNNKFKPDSTKLLHCISELSKNGTKPKLKSEVSRIVIGRHAEQLSYLKDKYGMFGSVSLDFEVEQARYFDSENVLSILDVGKKIKMIEFYNYLLHGLLNNDG